MLNKLNKKTNVKPIQQYHQCIRKQKPSTLKVKTRCEVKTGSEHFSLQPCLIVSDGKESILKNQARPLRNHFIFYSNSHTPGTKTRVGIELGYCHKFWMNSSNIEFVHPGRNTGSGAAQRRSLACETPASVVKTAAWRLCFHRAGDEPRALCMPGQYPTTV